LGKLSPEVNTQLDDLLHALGTNVDSMVIRVFVDPTFSRGDILFPKVDGIYQANGHLYMPWASRETAHLILEDGKRKNDIKMTSLMQEASPETRFTLSGDRTHLADVLDGIARFNYLLDHGNQPPPGFTLEMHRLKGEIFSRVPDLSVGNNGNMVDQFKVQLASDPNAMYGFTIRNGPGEDLFPYVFYFDPEYYTIQMWYCPSSRRAEPLKKGGQMTIGLGDETAFQFSLPAGQTSSSGFVKVIASTEPLDLEWIEQRYSPFDPEFSRRRMGRELDVDVMKWEALVVTLTMTE